MNTNVTIVVEDDRGSKAESHQTWEQLSNAAMGMERAMDRIKLGLERKLRDGQLLKAETQIDELCRLIVRLDGSKLLTVADRGTVDVIIDSRRGKTS